MNNLSIRQRFDFLKPAFRTANRRLLWARIVWVILALNLAGVVGFFSLIPFGAPVFPFISSAGLQWIVRPIQIFGIAAAALTIFLFPNGRFVPSWTRQLAFGLGIWLAALLIFPEITSAIGAADSLAPFQTGLRFIAWLFGTDI